METKKVLCAVDFCTRETHTYPKKTTFCRHHDNLYRRTGSPTGTEFLDFCTVEGCSSRHDKYGMCSLHYGRFKRTGSALPRPPKSPHCSVAGCSRPRDSKGLCSAHYQRLRITGEVGSPDFISYEIKECFIPYCSNNGGLVGSNLCRSHRQLAKKFSLPEDRYVEMMSVPCAICGSTDLTLAVDHDHSCCSGKESCGSCVRGTLCSRCNRVLGAVQENVNILGSMISYLSGSR